ncbi:MAG: hypothetical protein JSR86_05600 [Proteobacteria bacterium]|nr:hypothetical protein [Pseudomonadota bacterium]
MHRRTLLGGGLLALAATALAGPALADQQANVDAIIARIRDTLEGSMDQPDWPRRYALAKMNIEDLKKTLAYGGKVSSNPVAAFRAKLQGMLDERSAAFKVYLDTQTKLEHLRKTEARGAVADIGAEMIAKLTPKPGWGTVASSFGTHNASIIRQDFARLKTYEQGIKVIDGYIQSILPSIHDIEQRRNALGPLVSAYAALTQAGFDGTYVGSFHGGGAGKITFTVKGAQVLSGTISGSSGGDPVLGHFSGTISPDGTITTTLSGTLTDSSAAKLGSFPFAGHLNGRVVGAIGTGTWEGKNNWGNPKGDWSASRQ